MKYLRSSRMLFLLLLVNLLPQILLAQAGDGGNQNSGLQSPIETLSGVINPEILESTDPTNLENLTEQERQSAKKYLSQPTQYLLEIMSLLKSNYEKVLEVEERVGLEELIKKIQKRQDKDAVNVEVAGVGKAEPLIYRYQDKTMMFTKVRHNGAKRIFFFIDLDQIKLDLIEQAPNPELDPKTYQEELHERRTISHYFRVLAIRMLMNEWNTNIYYHGSTSNLTSPTLPDQIQEKVQEIMSASAETLESKSWFQNIKAKAADITLQIETEAQLKQGWDVMLVGYSSSKGQILATDTREIPIIFRDRGSFSANAKGVFVDTFRKWVMYWHKTWEPPAYNEKLWRTSKGVKKLRVLLTGDYLNGLVQGVFLGSLSMATMALFSGALPGSLDALSVGWNSFAFSLFFGVFTKTWQNFVSSGSEFMKFLKTSIPGVTQTYTMFWMGGVALAPIQNGQLDWEAINRHKDAAINQAIKSDSKVGLMAKPNFRKARGESHGTIKIPVPIFRMPFTAEMPLFELEVVEKEIRLSDIAAVDSNFRDMNKVRHLPELQELESKMQGIKYKDVNINIPWVSIKHIDTHIPKSSWEAQAIQIFTTPIGLISRFGTNVSVTIDAMAQFAYNTLVIPIGHIMYAALSPYGRYRNLVYKEGYLKGMLQQHGANHPDVQRLTIDITKEREKWDNLRILNIPFTNFAGYFFKELPVSAWKVVVAVSKWFKNQGLYQSYRFYRASSEAMVAIEEHRRSTYEATEMMNRLLLVRTEGSSRTAPGVIHPNQVENALREQIEANPDACRELFGF